MSQQGDDNREERIETDSGRAGAARPGPEPASDSRTKKIIAILGACTAALTLVTAALGVVSVRFNQQKDQAEGQATSLSTEVSVLAEQVAALETERDSLAGEVNSLREEGDRLEEELEEATDGEVAPPDSDPFRPNLTYLSEEPALNRARFDSGTAQVGGVTYLNSVMGEQGDYGGSDATQAHAEYDLGRGYDSLTATLGLSDTNRNANRTVKFEVIVDNEVIHDVTLAAGEAEPISLTITGGLRLRLQVTFFRPQDVSYPDRLDEAVWGDAALVVATETS